MQNSLGSNVSVGNGRNYGYGGLGHPLPLNDIQHHRRVQNQRIAFNVITGQYTRT